MATLLEKKKVGPYHKKYANGSSTLPEDFSKQ